MMMVMLIMIIQKWLLVGIMRITFIIIIDDDFDGAANDYDVGFWVMSVHKFVEEEKGH